MAAELIERRGARVVLIDEADRVLLLRGCDPATPEGPIFWFTPGGGVEGGETVEQAALRELREETGHADVPLGPPVWTRVAEFTFDGLDYRQAETFFAVRVAAFDVDTAGFTDLELRSVSGHRWWTLDDLEATDEAVYPTRLASLVRDLLRDGPPAAPLEVGV